jgi:hypothetical protein
MCGDDVPGGGGEVISDNRPVGATHSNATFNETPPSRRTDETCPTRGEYDALKSRREIVAAHTVAGEDEMRSTPRP